MFSFIKFIRLAVAVISVVLAIVQEVRKVMEQHFAQGETASA